MPNKHKGFTIVELLIVIVIIGILASITTVSYNGIQDRAKTAKTINLASSYIQGFKIWKADKGTFPAVYTCLGPTAEFSGSKNKCFAKGWINKAPYEVGFNATLNSYMGFSGALGEFGNADNSNENVKGAMWYHSNWYGNNAAVFGYTLGPDNDDCGLPDVLSSSGGTVTPTGAKYTEKADGYTYCLIALGER